MDAEDLSEYGLAEPMLNGAPHGGDTLDEEPPGSTQDEALFAATVDRRPAEGAPLALYRRYRPDTFEAVIGQEHVTAPLQRALANNRVGHAYLFSGPRGCGKTTSARILARALNCELGPRPEPCGRCQSCRDLARGGSGSIDVIEIDAASHGGVDDARDLRERAFFAPVSSRYKIYIVDEAHMVTTAGFNALLKLVEEPPPHVKFIFATTEPEKVIGTIRSRTHHYPFRLVPPRVLTDYLAKLCAAEGIAVEPAVLPLVVRAGAGSVRDSLSVLDQLLGGAADTGVIYQQAAALLGYTPDSLLDECVDAFAAGDAGGVFSCVDKVIEVGQDPRRFAEDLLRRLRDLVIVAAVPDALTSGLVDVAPDQAERLTSQAASLGPGELTRAAEVMAAGLTEMRGTTAPRLHLELMCARVLLPGADVDDRGVHARLDRLERRFGMVDANADVLQAPPSTASVPSDPPAAPARERPTGADRPAAPRPPRPEFAVRGPAGGETDDTALGAPPDEVDRMTGTAQAPGPAGGLSVADLRRLWPEVLEEIKTKRRFAWMLLTQYASVADLRDKTLVLAMSNPGARERFGQGGNEDILREALVVVLGADYRIETVVDPGGGGGGRSPGGTGSPVGGGDPGREGDRVPEGPGAGSSPGPRPGSGTDGGAQAGRTATEQAEASWGMSPAPSPPTGGADRPGASAREQARREIRPTRQRSDERGGRGDGVAPDEPDRDADATLDDSDLEDSAETHAELLARHLGAEIIAEEEHGA